MAASSKDDIHLERVTHLILLASRLHNAAVEGAVLPLVKQLSSGGGTMAQEMSAKMRETEECASEIAKTKKHASNQEFLDQMKKFEGLVDEGAAAERTALEAPVKEISEETLIEGADRMEEAKMNATLEPGKMAYA